MGVYFAAAAAPIGDLDLRAICGRIRVAPMQWSMPHRVLQVVAGFIVLVAVSAFTLGVVNAPTRGRMPGEKVGGSAGATPLAATDATPLSQDRIEGAFHRWWRAIEIQIVLRALAQILTVVRPLREPLENDKLDSRRG